MVRMKLSVLTDKDISELHGRFVQLMKKDFIRVREWLTRSDSSSYLRN